MGVTIKNLRPGVLILADARLRLGPGEAADVEAVTPQIRKALTAGYVARLDEDQSTGTRNADQPPLPAVETAAERTAGGDETDSAGRRGGPAGKRPSLDALRVRAEETAGGAG